MLVLANKQDLPGALDPKEIEKLLGLHELPLATPMPCQLQGVSSSSSTPAQSPVGGGGGGSSSTSTSQNPTSKLYYVQSSCAVTGEGLHEGLEVLYEMITKKRKLSKTTKKKR